MLVPRIRQYRQQLAGFRDRIVFGLNQIDIVHRMDWNDHIDLPPVNMETNIADTVKGRAKKSADVIGRVPDPVPFPAARGFNLEMLFNRLITSLEGVAHATNRMRHVAQGMPVDSVTLTLAQLPEFPVALPANSGVPT
jgi:hypothetical protein